MYITKLPLRTVLFLSQFESIWKNTAGTDEKHFVSIKDDEMLSLLFSELESIDCEITECISRLIITQTQIHGYICSGNLKRLVE